MATRLQKQAKTDSLTVRIAPDDKRRIVDAAASTGEDVTSFLLTPAVKRARDLFDHESVTVRIGANRQLFIDLLEAPPSERHIRNLQDDRHQIVE